ncbi:energy transducer TonB family protein [Rhizobium sp. Root564]|uniref:energy transducer TonB family protein n=1 Tax=Agrobacterium cavarae TaxID=2528239 RepID=UPI0007129DE1|nr:energy transducer TonB [Rhizobium sp. Root564]
MTDPVYPRSRQSRLGEIALWSVAALVMISVHAAGAYYLMQEKPEEQGDNAPQAAIMIELAALPEAVNTEETVEANDEVETEEVKSNVTQPVEEPPPVEPPPEPVPEPVVDEPPVEPEPTPEVPPEVVQQPVEEPAPPEPVQEVDPIEQQQVAELENVEVPLPVLRPPPPPPVQKKVEKEKEPEKKRVQKPTLAPQQSQRRDIAKAEATQSDRTAASRNSAGSASSSVSPADWASKVQSAVARRIVRGAGRSGMTVTVSFVVQNDGSIGRLSVVKSTGDEAVDAKIKSSIGRASVSTPPPGAQTSFVVPVEIR